MSPPRVDTLDHLVLTVADMEATVRFYTQVLGMQLERFGEGRLALRFGSQKINLHPAEAPLRPHAARPTAGSGDLCLRTRRPPAEWVGHLAALDVAVELGPVARTGAEGPMTSLYVRDPDGNLVEIGFYGEE
ncbi:MAG: VOC family protein [Betaproteobacteria bacterium]|nr:VOC family protein [Betaproteobacteria bacterium]